MDVINREIKQDIEEYAKGQGFMRLDFKPDPYQKLNMLNKTCVWQGETLKTKFCLPHGAEKEANMATTNNNLKKMLMEQVDVFFSFVDGNIKEYSSLVPGTVYLVTLKSVKATEVKYQDGTTAKVFQVRVSTDTQEFVFSVGRGDGFKIKQALMRMLVKGLGITHIDADNAEDLATMLTTTYAGSKMHMMCIKRKVTIEGNEIEYKDYAFIKA